MRVLDYYGAGADRPVGLSGGRPVGPPKINTKLMNFAIS